MTREDLENRIIKHFEDYIKEPFEEELLAHNAKRMSGKYQLYGTVYDYEILSFFDGFFLGEAVCGYNDEGYKLTLKQVLKDHCQVFFKALDRIYKEKKGFSPDQEKTSFKDLIQGNAKPRYNWLEELELIEAVINAANAMYLYSDPRSGCYHSPDVFSDLNYGLITLDGAVSR